MKLALISVSHKEGLADFAKKLHQRGVKILSTSGTAKELNKNQIPTIEVSDYTGFPEILDGRVKTLHPKIYAGLLARHFENKLNNHKDEKHKDEKLLEELSIPMIDLVVVNLYPFQQTIEKENCTKAQAIEQIDIGGPTLIRAAAKNHNRVTVIVDPSDYSAVLEEVEQDGTTSIATRNRLAQKAFAHTAYYDSVIAKYLLEKEPNLLPQELTLSFHQRDLLRYGENPHQQAAWYSTSPRQLPSLSEATLQQGKPLSFNNLLDSDAAYQCVFALPSDVPACVIIKHATPCGVAQGKTLTEAYNRAFQADPISAFGGIIAFNRRLDATTATTVINQQFVEVIIAPGIEADAIKILETKPNVRLLIAIHQENSATTAIRSNPSLTLRSISGGLLVQEQDFDRVSAKDLTVVTRRAPTESELKDLLFAWKVCQFVKSNAIVYAKDGMTLGVGAGQTSRVFSAKIAILKANEANLSLSNAVMASDAFIPFPDTVEVAASAGVTAIIQTGGSKQDPEVVSAADKAGIAMVFTKVRHFRH